MSFLKDFLDQGMQIDTSIPADNKGSYSVITLTTGKKAAIFHSQIDDLEVDDDGNIGNGRLSRDGKVIFPNNGFEINLD